MKTQWVGPTHQRLEVKMKAARGACLWRKRKISEYTKRYVGLLGRGDVGGDPRRSGLAGLDRRRELKNGFDF
jgi:hypothetical protein